MPAAKKLFTTIAVLLFLTGAAGFAAEPEKDTAEIQLNFSDINKTLDGITKKINGGSVSREESDDYIATLNSLQNQILNEQKQDTATLQSMTQKISALNGLADENGKDVPEVAKERKTLEDSAAKYKSLLAQEALALAKIDEINALIFKARNKELLTSVLAKQSSIFQPEQFWQSLLSFGSFLKEILVSPFNWYRQLKPEQQQNAAKSLIILTLMLGAALILAVVIRGYIKKHYGYNLEICTPTYIQRLKAAAWIFVALGAIPAAIIAALWVWINGFDLMKGSEFAALLRNAAIYLLYFLILRAAILAAFAPNNPDWRIFNIEARKVRRASNALITAAAAITAVSFFQKLATEMSHEPEIVYSMQIFANGIKAFAVIWAALRVMYDVKDLSDEDVKSGNIQKLSASAQTALLITFFMIGSFTFSLFGYISLFYHLIVRRRFWITTFRISPRTLVKSEVWFGIILTPVLYLFGALVLLAVWGVSVDILVARTKGFLTGFNIGEVHVSITSIILGLVSFWVAMLLVKMLKSSLQDGSLSRLDFDEGMKSSIISGIGFFGFILSVILGIAVAGGSFKSLALMAGALSFGAGLGLQNVVSNLVAGITILFERPIKLGDLVVINGYEGVVKQISMRSTTLETGNKSNVIIPNSAIIAGSVVNINVGVDYDSDIDKVKKILLRIAGEDEEVLSNPAPALSFLDFGDSSLNFQLNCYTANIANSSGISFRIREKIINEFRKEGINIPFPQRVVRSLEESAAD